MKLNESLKLAGSFSKEDKKRMALEELSEGTQVMENLYNIGNSKDF